MSIANLLTPNNYDLYCNDLNVAGDLTIDGDVIINGEVTFNDVVHLEGGATFASVGAPTPSILNYYETGNFNATFTGPSNNAVPLTITVTFARIGNLVTLYFPDMLKNAVAADAGTISAGTNTIPSRLRPQAPAATLTNFPIKVHNNITKKADPGLMQINNIDGTIILWQTMADTVGTENGFNGAGTGGFYSCTISYLI